MVMLATLLSLKQVCQPMYDTTPLKEGYKLEYLSIIFKHGLRAPVDKIPNFDIYWNCSNYNWIYPGGDPHKDDYEFVHQFRIKPIESQSFLKGTCRAGDLLDIGFQQMKNLSDHLKNVYHSFLPKDGFDRRTINARSTYTNRCLASLQALIHYLFESDDVIDTFVSNEELETMIPNPYLCPKLADLMNNQLENNISFKELLDDLKKDLNEIKSINKIVAIPKWNRIPELFSTHYCMYGGFPGGYNETHLNKSIYVFEKYYENIISDENTRKYMSGLFLSDIFQGIVDGLTNPENPTTSFFSGHTLTMISLMSIFKLPVMFPPYASYFAIELYRSSKDNLFKKDKELVIRVLFNGMVVKEYTFNEFHQLVASLHPSESECELNYPFMEADKKSPISKILKYSFS